MTGAGGKMPTEVKRRGRRKRRMEEDKGGLDIHTDLPVLLK